MAQVFISYSRKDKDFARKLGEALAVLKRWARIYRPAGRDWIVVGSGSIDIPGVHRADQEDAPP